MFLVEILLPTADNEGAAFPPGQFVEVRDRLTERFGGVTAHLRAPARGFWRTPDAEVARDDIVIIEVMVEAIERDWWRRFRGDLERQFRQDEVVIRAFGAERL